MMKKIVLLALIVAIGFSCNREEKHFLKEKAYRETVYAQFEKRKQQAKHRHEALFSLLDREDLSLEQKEALQFLYAYMPLCDLADYDGDFFLQQVDAALLARDYFPWGRSVPDDLFRHFVLVYRINNENLDTARMVFFEELKDRVKDLSMYEAALEVNHWCHEKVTYRGTDARTSAPLALVRTAWGRCGEESTFTATALRAVGIPARQVYTPRWVHTDSNHAWVEVWIDGQWHYLGACEPDYELDRAWFDGPAQRAMMMHTNVFGYYTGPEEKTIEQALYSVINLLDNYAETRTVTVYVQDVNGMPVRDARVQFKVYNYAEFYPIATTLTNEEGKTSIISGKGDLMVWANKGDKYGCQKSTPDMDIVTVVLNRNPGVYLEEADVMNVPGEKSFRAPDPMKLKENAVRLAYEDSIRNAYMHTFATEDYAKALARDKGLDEKKTWNALYLAQGNWKEIESFILNHKESPSLFPFLASLTEKDLRDTPANYLSDHFQAAAADTNPYPEDLFVSYILSPRIDIELITPWRSFFRKEFDEERQQQFRDSIALLIDYVKERISIHDEENYYNCRITPKGVHELRIADSQSCNIYFVALCRSMNIPARIETSTGKTQYYDREQWIDVHLTDPSAETWVEKGFLGINKHADNIVKPGYSNHYTIAKYEDGDFKTLSFRNNEQTNNFPYVLELDKGIYRLLTGSRANDGSVFVSTQYFEILPGDSHIVEIKLPEVEGKLLVKGIIDMNSIIERDNADKTTLKDLANNKGLMLCFLDPGREPSIHILQDLPNVSDALNEWDGGVLMLIPEDKINSTFDPGAFKGLPLRTSWAVDKSKLLEAATTALQLESVVNFPLSLYLTKNGGIIYSSEGYRIGIGEDILRTIHLENQ